MTPLNPGDTLAGKYEILRQIGRGGFGAVYAATQHPVGRLVAIKVIIPERAHDPQLARRFFREARAIARLRHSSTVTLHDYGVDDSRLYMVMEYIEGTDLSRVIRMQGPLAPGRVTAIALQAAGALAEAHALELVHRDVKPANMMITTGALGDEQLKLLDFGIAKLLDTVDDTLATRTGLVIGTPCYMSPEQGVGRGVGPATDQYALGVVMYQMLTGKKPFDAPSTLEILNAHRTQPVPSMRSSLGIPTALEIIVRRALSKDTHERFPDMRSMARALRTVAVEVPDDTHAAPPMQERSTVHGISPPADEPLWTPTGATSLEMRGDAGHGSTQRRGSRSHAVLAMLLAGAAGTGVTVALLAADPSGSGTPSGASSDGGADVASRIAVGMAPAPDAAAPDASVPDAAMPDAAVPDARVESKPVRKTSARTVAPTRRRSEPKPVRAASGAPAIEQPIEPAVKPDLVQPEEPRRKSSLDRLLELELP